MEACPCILNTLLGLDFLQFHNYLQVFTKKLHHFVHPGGLLCCTTRVPPESHVIKRGHDIVEWLL